MKKNQKAIKDATSPVFTIGELDLVLKIDFRDKDLEKKEQEQEQEKINKINIIK